MSFPRTLGELRQSPFSEQRLFARGVMDELRDNHPKKAARGEHELSSALAAHCALLPRAGRGISAVNELPDLAGNIQVGLFNIMQEGDVQIKGYPVRQPLDVALVFSASPEDYT